MSTDGNSSPTMTQTVVENKQEEPDPHQRYGTARLTHPSYLH